MNEKNEPDWLAELAKGGEAVRRQIELLAQGAQRFIRDGQQAMASSGPVPPLQDRVVRAVGAAMREFAPGRLPVIHPVLLPTTVIGHSRVTGGGAITATGSLAMAPMSFSGHATVEKRRRRLAKFSDGEIVFLVLVWIYAVWLPWVGSKLPPELHAMLTDSYATMAIALGITWRMLDKHK